MPRRALPRLPVSGFSLPGISIPRLSLRWLPLPRVSPVVRISLGLVSATAGLFILSDLIFGLSPDHIGPMLEARKQLTETLAVQVTTLSNNRDMSAVQSTLSAAVERHPDVISAGLRLVDGNLRASAGDHEIMWGGASDARSTPSHARVSIFQGGQVWADLEVRFRSLAPAWQSALASNPFVKAVVFVCIAGFAAYLIFMKRTLRHLDPAAVIPGRVRAALDTLSEGVVMIDADEQIVLVNKAFEAGSGQSMAELLARRLSTLPWRFDDSESGPRTTPWAESLADGETHTGQRIGLGDEAPRTYAVNAAPVLDEHGNCRGAMVTFDDLTELEAAHEGLRKTLRKLEHSQREIQQQNERLEIMATRDALTNCLNRGAFHDQLVSLFELCEVADQQLACVMADIDLFKTVNDVFGHQVGDEAIKLFASTIQEGVRASDVVGRYGGEEFCFVLYGCDADQAMAIAEKIRHALESTSGARLPILAERGLTASFGVSISTFGASTSEELVGQADAALYESKHAGRNKVTLWTPDEAAVEPAAAVAG